MRAFSSLSYIPAICNENDTTRCRFNFFIETC
jgi:hypothetical protein